MRSLALLHATPVLAGLLVAACQTTGETAKTKWIKAPPEPVRSIRWVATEGPGPFYRAEGNQLDGTLRFAHAEASQDAIDKLWSPSGTIVPEGLSVGLGSAPRGMPPEFAFWLGVADLHRQRKVEEREARARYEADAEKELLTASRTLTRFVVSPGVACSTSFSRKGAIGESGFSPSSAADQLYGFTPTERVRSRYGLVRESGWVSWSMGPFKEGGYALEVHVSGDASNGGSSESNSWSLLCRSEKPIFASELPKYAAEGTETPDGWSVRVAATN